MPDQAISADTALTGANLAAGDKLPVVDVSAAVGSRNKNMTPAELAAGLALLGGVVIGPASATDNALARFDATTGKLLQNSGVTVDDNGIIMSGGFKRKTADQTVTNSTTLVDDAHLTAPLLDGKSYHFNFSIYVTIAGDNQFLAQLSGTATHTAMVSEFFLVESAATPTITQTIISSTTPSDHTITSVGVSTGTVRLTISGTTTALVGGTFTIAFALATENIGVDSVTFGRGSTLLVVEIP